MNLSALFNTTSLGGGVLSRRFFFASQSWTCTVAGTYKIHAWGGSGTGGVSRGSWGYTTGGGGGAKATKTVKLTAGDVLTFTIGAGGVANNVVTNGHVNGNNGGDTIVTGPNGLNMVAGGGKGGKAIGTLTSILGGLGGVATGGDENLPGGRGGDCAALSSGSVIGRATGGGGLPVAGPGRRGGDILSTTFGARLATGGAGAGGDGGDIIAGSGGGDTSTGGGGSITSGVSTIAGGAGVTAGGKALVTIAVPGKIDVPLTPWFPYSGEGQTGVIASGVLATDAGPGGGSGGSINSSTAGMSSRGAGIFGGSGGSVSGSSGQGTSGVFAGAVNPFVGGSGGAVSPLTNQPGTAAAGGDGWIIVERLS